MVVVPFPTKSGVLQGQAAVKPYPLIWIDAPHGILSAELVPTVLNMSREMAEHGLGGRLSISRDEAGRLFESDQRFTHFLIVVGSLCRDLSVIEALRTIERNRVDEVRLHGESDGLVHAVLMNRRAYLHNLTLGRTRDTN